MTIPASFFGCAYINAGAEMLDPSTNANSLPIGSTRTEGVSSSSLLEWNILNTASGSMNIAPLTALVQSQVALKRRVIVGLGSSPGWAASATNMAPTAAAWTAWVTSVGTALKGLGVFYDVWNEVNNSQFWNQSQPLSSLLSLASTAYKLLKSIDPTCVVLTPSFTTELGVSTSAINATAYLSAGGAQYADMFAIHSYDSASNGPMAENLYKMVGDYQALTNLPVIVTEGSWGWAASALTDPTQQAMFLTKWFLIHLMRGVQAATWYAYDAGLPDGGLSSTGVLTPAGTAFKDLIAEFSGATLGEINVAGSSYSMNYTTAAGVSKNVAWASPTQMPVITLLTTTPPPTGISLPYEIDNLEGVSIKIDATGLLTISIPLKLPTA